MHLRCPHCQNPIELADLPSAGEITCAGCGSSFQFDNLATANWVGPTNKRIGKFEVLGTLGHGAFGTVLKAHDTELHRIVAIKIPRASNVGRDPQDVDRFLREARSVAQLRFPSIITIHEVGLDNGIPYLVCDFVEGVTLADLLTGRRPTFHESAQLLAEVADALQYAHSLGVVHRDVKPSNIMIRPDSSPCVMDFGLAKRDAGEITMTIDGQILGTPAFMSPEQARGEGHRVDGRSDVYSLGVILYQLLSGELPFRGNKAMLLHQVLHDEPLRPRTLNDKIPRDLETIALKAMAKEPTRRYFSAKEMADDLRRWLAGEPILARPVGPLERSWRWCKRKPALAAANAAILVALITFAAAFFIVKASLDQEQIERGKAQELAKEKQQLAADEQDQRIKAQKLAEANNRLAIEATEREREANAERAKAKREASLRALDLGQTLLDQGDGGRGLLWVVRGFEAAPIGLDGDDLRRVAWGILATGHSQIHTLEDRLQTARNIHGLVFSPDGKYFAIGPDLAVYDAGTRKRLWEKPGRRTHALVFSKDGATLWTGSALGDGAGETGEIARWVAATGEAAGPPLKLPSAVWSLALHPQQNSLLMGCADGTMRRWDLDAEMEPVVVHQEKRGISQVAFSPDGKWVLTCAGVAFKNYFENRDKVKEPALIWDAATFRPTGVKLIPKNVITRAMFTPDGKRVLIGGGGSGGLYDAQTGKLITNFPGALAGLDVSRDGRLMATAGHDYKGRVWTADGQQIGNLLFHNGWQWTAAFAPDAAILVIGGYSRLSFWRLRTPLRPSATPLNFPDKVSNAAFSADGATAALRQDGAVQAWDTATGLPVGPKVAAPVIDGWANFRFAPDGRTLICPSTDGKVHRWNVVTGKVSPPLDHGEPVVSVAITPDGQTIASGSTHGTIKLWDAAKGILPSASRSVFATHISNSWVNGLDFARDGRTLGAGTWHFTTYLWDTPVGEPRKLVRSSGAIVCLRFSPDGRHIALALAGDDVVTLHDSQTGVRIGPPLAALGAARSLAFSPDGRTLATGTGDKVRLWDVATGRRLGPPLPCRGSVRAVSFRDDRTLLTADSSGVLRWDLYDPRPPSAERLRLWIELIIGMEMDEQGGVNVLADLAGRRKRLAELGGPPVQPPQ